MKITTNKELYLYFANIYVNNLLNDEEPTKDICNNFLMFNNFFYKNSYFGITDIVCNIDECCANKIASNNISEFNYKKASCFERIKYSDIVWFYNDVLNQKIDNKKITLNKFKNENVLNRKKELYNFYKNYKFTDKDLYSLNVVFLIEKNITKKRPFTDLTYNEYLYYILMNLQLNDLEKIGIIYLSKLAINNNIINEDFSLKNKCGKPKIFYELFLFDDIDYILLKKEPQFDNNGELIYEKIPF